MTPFEYVTVLISIILGLGITQIITGVADMIHQWERVKLYWPHLMWIVFVFFLHVEEWWVIYNLQKVEVWEMSMFLFVILYPINLFILARILFPFGTGDAGTDFKEFYFNNFRKFFIWVILLSLLSLFENLFVHGYSISEQPIQICLVLGISFLTYKNYKREWVHKWLVILLSCLLLAALLFIEKPLTHTSTP
jgi:hypothetical protein